MLSNNLVKSLLFASLLTPTLYGCGGGESGGDAQVDNTPPVVTLNGSNNIELILDTPYVEPGAKAIDEVDGNIEVVISGDVDTSALGTYLITYTAKDAAGNEVTLTREITVVAAPVSSITKLFTSPSKYIDVFPGKARTIAVTPEFDGADKNAFIQLENNPEWITIDENALITITPEAAIEATTISFDVIATVEGETISKRKTLVVSILNKITLVSGVLGASGGTIENDWKDIAISVEANKLSQEYNVRYDIGIDVDGEVSFSLESEPAMPEAEMAALNIIQPSVEEIIHNYTIEVPTFRSNRAMFAKENMIAADALAIYSANGVDQACKPGINRKDLSANEMVWGHRSPEDEESEDSQADKESKKFNHLALSYVWQGKEDLFDESGYAGASVRGMHPRLQNGKKTKHAKVRCASALRSPVAIDNEEINGKIAVLLVHGFINSGELGGYNQEEDNAVDGLYFGRFPTIINEWDNGKYLPFVFQWRTNAKFQDVATELADAVKLIAEKTGQKVNIVAHSFGGILSRTLVQGLATSYPEQYYVEDYVQTLTTVGTPHSGVFGSEKLVSFDEGVELEFPQGRNGGLGALIENCSAITCYQAGVEVQKFEGNELYGTENSEGYISYKLAQTLQSYPNVKTQVLIGLVPSNVHCEDRKFEQSVSSNSSCSLTYDLLHTSVANPGIGDNLISLQGQRFHPGFLTSPLKANPALHYEEHLLPMNVSSFDRGMDNYLIDHYEEEWLDSWKIPKYGDASFKYFKSTGHGFKTAHGIKEIRHYNQDSSAANYYVFGYNHRTSAYKEQERFTPNFLLNSLTEIVMYMPRLTEVGLHNCQSATDCNHGTWHYVNDFLKLTPSQPAPTSAIIQINGTVVVSENSVTSPLSDGVVWVYANNRRVESSEAATDQNGHFNIEVEFLPNTQYHLLVRSRVDGVFRMAKTQAISTADTIEESRLQFPLVTLVKNSLPSEAMGDLTLSIKDAANGRQLSGFSYQINNPQREIDRGTTVSASHIVTQPNGDYRITFKKEGYNDARKICTVSANTNNICEVSMIAKSHLAQGDLSAILEWNVDPNDLDSHLIKYDATGKQLYHVFYNNEVAGDAKLDVDDTSSYGPETITINNIEHEAYYIYAVHHFSGSGSITSTSQARVRLQTGDVDTTYYAPSTGEGRWWKVFEIKDGRIIPCNSGCIINGDLLSQRARTNHSSKPSHWLKDISEDLKTSKTVSN
ncbi:DUF5011 domain-containing protein [Vibrio sp. IRLE0018]|uniref:immunoglobulin-like domain-containing protein n=1 Tax=Vibrio floridensis TaxID=2908007 RepID=UPI001F223D89|nr:immunoglobulin-like domain-containing protein [Vibrio floridensis]MCF8778380.1 DUF5011 domain-containing protein [Vibrio floridensis]